MAVIVNLGNLVAESVTNYIESNSESFKGPEGDSAYEIALSNGFIGTEAEWLTSLIASAKVGNTDGNTAGNTVGNTANNTAGNTVGNTTGNTVGNTAGNTVGNTTGNTAGNTVGNTAGNTVGNTTGNTVGNTAGNTAGNNPLHQWSGTQLRFTTDDNHTVWGSYVDLKGQQAYSDAEIRAKYENNIGEW